MKRLSILHRLELTQGLGYNFHRARDYICFFTVVLQIALGHPVTVLMSPFGAYMPNYYSFVYFSCFSSS